MVRRSPPSGLHIDRVSDLLGLNEGQGGAHGRYGMVAALCEEVREPAREVPRAMVLSVAAAAITGLVYLVNAPHNYYDLSH
jgi:hypothetical protein